MLDNGTVAVKKLCNMLDMDEKKFSEEIRCLMKATHKNVVRFLRYCSDRQGEMVNCEGKLVLADVRQRLLCFEYLPKGSLDKHITDVSCGLEWRKRYQIINGICDGLYYLHQNHIVHLDLKPANILLDDTMLPKIADFGLSRCFDEKQSRAITSKRDLAGRQGYLAPEFYTRRQITFKLDIYSLGMIIIEILIGDRGYADIDNV
uniref:non-specific serine/threonine protein kinase n=1 Tax=Triticum urartu TaxID=4572 RepID=A0A8R7RD52_TRIUA